MNRICLAMLFMFIIQIQSKSQTTLDNHHKSLEVSTFTENTALPQWVSIFNGKDLKGWTPKIVGHEAGFNFGNTFRVDKEILSIRYDGYGDNFNNRFGALYYDKKVSDFRLKITYRFVGETAPGAPEWGFRDSGVQFFGQHARTMPLEQPFPISLEYNLHGGNGFDDRPVGEVCANGIVVEIDGKPNTSYCTQPTLKKTFHGDQWVVLEIDVNKGHITHFVNGEEILSYKNPAYDPSNPTAAKLIVHGDTMLKDGYISLQSNSHPIDFRSIELWER